MRAVTPEGLGFHSQNRRHFREATEALLNDPAYRAALENLWLTVSRHGVKVPDFDEVCRLYADFFPTGDGFGPEELDAQDWQFVKEVRDGLCLLAQLAAVRERM